MKRNDYILVVILSFIACLFIIFNVLSPVKEKPVLVIKVDDKVWDTFNLDEDQTIEINDTNTCVIKNGKVSMTEANCPDKICVHSKAIDNHGGTIVCLPNKVFLEIENGDESIDSVAS